MELLPVNCNHCGASLEIPANARFVTCRYCNSQLEVKRTESTVTTEVLDRIDTRTAAMAEDLQALRRESEIERLDREWGQRQAQLLIRDKNGNASKPSAVGGIIGAVVMGGFGLLWTIGAFGITSAGSHIAGQFGGEPAGIKLMTSVFPCFGIIFVAAAIGLGIRTVISSGKFDAEERRYLARREQLLQQQNSGEATKS